MAEDSKYGTLTDAMLANDELGEAVLRYRLVDEAFMEAEPKERKALSIELNSLMEKIVRLRAAKGIRSATDNSADASPSEDEGKFGKVVSISAAGYRKSS